MFARCHAPGVTVVAFVPSLGPVPPPAIVVMPAASVPLVHLRGGDEVDVRVDPARGEDATLTGDDVGGRADPQGGVHAVGDVGVPGAADAADDPVADPHVGAGRSRLWSRTTAFVMTVSGAPSARDVVPCAMDSRMDLPPPNTASSPPTVKS